jgi:thioesterase domain-containing protein
MSAAGQDFGERARRLSPDRRRLLERLRPGSSGMTASRCAPRIPGAGPEAVVLRPGHGPERLVLVHPSGGALFCYVPVTRALRPGPAVLGFPSHVSDREPPAERRVVAVAARILTALREAADPARCVLAGWSYGGSVAFEMGRQLAEQDGSAPPAVLIDPPFLDEVDMPIPDELELRRQFAHDLTRLHGDNAGAMLRRDSEPVDLRAVGVSLGLTDAELHDRYLTFAAASSALYRYRPRGVLYQGPVYLLTAGHEPEIATGWRRSTAREFHHLVLSGDHYTVFNRENLPTVLGAIEDALDVLRLSLEVRT